MMSNPNPSSGQKLLLAMSDPVERQVVAELFRSADPSFEVVTADSAEALATFSAELSTFQALLVDQDLPGSSGLSFCREWLQQQLNIPHILLIRTAQEDIILEALEIGVHHYLVKDGRGGYLQLLPGVLRRVIQQHNNRLAARKTEEARRQRYQLLRTVYLMSDAVSRAGDVQQIYREALNGIEKALRADRAAIMVFEHDDVMHFTAWRNLSETYRNAVTEQSLWVPAEDSRKPLLFKDVAQANISDALRTVLQKEGIAAMGLIPLHYRGKVLGKFTIYYNQPHNFTETDIQLAQTIASHISVATERKLAEQEREKLIAEIQEALANVKTLSGLVPICASCKKIRDDKGYWQKIEAFLEEYAANAKFSHGICPDCMIELYPQIFSE